MNADRKRPWWYPRAMWFYREQYYLAMDVLDEMGVTRDASRVAEHAVLWSKMRLYGRLRWMQARQKDAGEG